MSESARNPETRDEYIFMAKLAEQAERYDDMVEFVKKVVEKQSSDLTLDERTLLSVAFKNVIGTRRSSWRIITTVDQREENPQIQAYRAKIEKEIADICADLLKLLKEHLIPTAQTAEAKVFFYKMQGDYHRYHAEVATGAKAEEVKNAARDAYQTAWDLATSSLRNTHPVRLGLALNFSVFYYEILKQPERGCELARTAFDEAMENLEHCEEAEYKESTLIMQLLRDNVTLWAEDMGDVEAPEEK